MKTFVLTVASIFIVMISLHAQLHDPVKWDYAAIKNSDNEYTVTISETLDPDWHIYSINTPIGGPVPTTFTFKKNPLVVIDGKTIEKGKSKTVHDDIFGVDVKYYGENVMFVQVVRLKSPVKTNLSGTVKYMVCNEKMCMPPKTVPFNIQLQ